MKTKYRIVTDEYNGYECQIKRWWLPFWYQMGGSNTFSSMRGALQYIDGQRYPVWQSDQSEAKETKGKVIEIGWLGVVVIIWAVIGAITIIAILISPWFPNFISK